MNTYTISYTHLSSRPSAFRSLTGLGVAEFDTLYAEFFAAHQERLPKTLTQRDHQPRKKAFGSGRRHSHDLRDRLVMTLIWLRIYPTYEVLGFLFSLNKTNVEDNLHAVLATLDLMSGVCAKRPDPTQRKVRSVAAFMEAFPDVALIIDAKEQRIQRPKSTKDDNKQKPYYSGKKKTHTLKNQVAVYPDGWIEAVSDSVPGGANHDITVLRQSDLLEQLDDGEGAMFDKGYDGITKDYPDKSLHLPFKARRGHPLTPEQKEYNRILSRHRIVVEHTNAQLNRFQVLAQVWRHKRENHSHVFRTVSGLVNRRTQACPLKTYTIAASAA